MDPLQYTQQANSYIQLTFFKVQTPLPLFISSRNISIVKGAGIAIQFF